VIKKAMPANTVGGHEVFMLVLGSLYEIVGALAELTIDADIGEANTRTGFIKINSAAYVAALIKNYEYFEWRLCGKLIYRPKEILPHTFSIYIFNG
jgi:hypothetical protein